MEQVEIWASILADPLPSQQEGIEVYSTCLDYDTMDFQALLEGPQDEHDLDRLLNGAFNPSYMKDANLTHEARYSYMQNYKLAKQMNVTNGVENLFHQIECKIYSPTSDHGMTIQTPAPAPPEALLEKEDSPATTALGGGGEEEMREAGRARYPPPCHWRSRRLAPTTPPPEEGGCDLLVEMPKSGWRHGSRVRSARRRGTWSINMEPCTRNLRSPNDAQKRGHRRNNDHWTSEEVKELVDGVSAYGAGHWAKLKNERFPISVRTAEHLKDKWRNLLKAYTVRPTSKKKGNAKRRISPPLDRDCIKKIQRLAADYPRK